MSCGISLSRFDGEVRIQSALRGLVQRSLQLCLLAIIASSLATADEVSSLLTTIRLRGLPNDEVPVVTSVAIQPRGNLLATSGDDHAVRLWELETGELKRTLRGHGDWVTSVGFCNEGTQLLTGGRDRRLLMWDLDAPSRPVPLGRHASPISSITIHPTTDRVAVVGFRAPLKIYDTRNRRLLNTLKCPCSDTRAIAFSPDGDLLAAGGRNGKLRIWNLTTGRQFDMAGHSRRITSVVFASDQLLLSAGEDQTIHVWDVNQHTKQHSLSHDAGKVLAMTMIDENRFAAGTAQNVIAVFHLQDALPYTVLKGHTGSVAALVARNQQLVTGSFDTTVRIWAIADGEDRNQAATSQPTKATEEPARSASVSNRNPSPSIIIE